MPNIKYSDLPDKTKSMHYAQARWMKKNWRESLHTQSAELEQLLSLIELFDIWKNYLPKNNDSVKQLLREMIADAYVSIHLAGLGLYKHAYMSLRSQFETAARLIYFSSHPQEYGLWKNGDEKWKKLLRSSDVWGDDWGYFTSFFPEVDKLEKAKGISSRKLWLTKGESPKLKGIYSQLSKFVHSVGPAMQTRSGWLTPKYDQSEMAEWCRMFRDVQKYINILFTLCFIDNIKKMSSPERDRILNEGIGSDYKDSIVKVCGL